MRYILAVLMGLVALAFVWVLRASLPSAPMGGASAPSVSVTPVMESEAIPTPDLAILTSRENLIASAKNMARAMGEKTPQFKAFHTTTLGRLSDLPAFRYSEADHSDERDRRVYVVQLTGSFYPLSGPPEIYDEPPTDGTLSIVYDARTGKQLQLTFP